MNLNHLNLVVTDLEATGKLFVDLFGLTPQGTVGTALAMYRGDNGFSLVLSAADRFAKDSLHYPPAFHIGFIVDDPHEVDRIHEQVIAYGLSPNHAPRRQHGSYGFYVLVLDEFLIEIGCYASQYAAS